jgi:tetratricopeptide (TPR) repeat protein
MISARKDVFMFRRVFAVALLLILAVRVPPACAQNVPENQVVPDEQAVRQQVDALLKTFRDSKKRATSGMIQQAVSLSISYGAPSWNHGDHAACSRFYVQTAQSLLTVFADKSSATPAARGALDDLQLAVDRAHAYGDDDRSAWSLRYAFEKNQITCDVTAQKAQSLIAIGEQYLKRSQLLESEDALRTAVTSLSELDGEPIDAMPVAARYAPLALANALFAEEQFDDASTAILKGLQYIPQWPGVDIDLRQVNGTEAEYQTYLTALEGKAVSDPKNASVQFLLGYQYWFTGRHADAVDCFHRTLKLEPNHPGALIFLNPDAGKTDPNKPKA